MNPICKKVSKMSPQELFILITSEITLADDIMMHAVSENCLECCHKINEACDEWWKNLPTVERISLTVIGFQMKKALAPKKAFPRNPTVN